MSLQGHGYGYDEAGSDDDRMVTRMVTRAGFEGSLGSPARSWLDEQTYQAIDIDWSQLSYHDWDYLAWTADDPACHCTVFSGDVVAIVCAPLAHVDAHRRVYHDDAVSDSDGVASPAGYVCFWYQDNNDLGPRPVNCQGD